MNSQELYQLINSQVSEDTIISAIENHFNDGLFLPTSKGKRVLFLAINYGMAQVVKKMLTLHQVKPELFNLQDTQREGNNALMVAIKARAHAITEQLLDYYIQNPKSFNINHQNKEGLNALHLMLTSPHKKSIDELRKLLQIDSFNWTSLNQKGQHAFLYMMDSLLHKFDHHQIRVDLVSFLIDYNKHYHVFDFNLIDKNDMNAFLYACCLTNVEILQSFLDDCNLFDVYHKNTRGDNAFVLAQYDGDIFDMLLNHSKFQKIEFIQEAMDHLKFQSYKEKCEQCIEKIIIHQEKKEIENIISTGNSYNLVGKLKI